MIFRKVVRGVFLFAYAAFLYASLRHIAYFFASFEPAGSDWTGAYALAISIDVTALILTIGVMFFRKGMSGWALAGIWFFIFCLTAFSWIVNWEYAVQFQGQGLSKATVFQWMNPILASAFAFLNLAYSVIAELFNSKPKTAEELQRDLAELQQKSRVQSQISDLKNQQNSSWIHGKIQMFSDAISGRNQAQIEHDSEQDLTQISPEIEDEITVISGSNLPQNHVKILPKLGTIPPPISDAPLPLQATRPSQYLMTFEEASAYTGYAISTLKKQLATGEIVANKSGDKLKVSTLRIRTGMTGKMPAVTVEKVPATNGRH